MGLELAGPAPQPYDDPLDRVLALGAETYGPVRWVGYSLGAVTLMFALTSSAAAIERVLRAPANRSALALSQEIEVFREEPPPPPPPEPEPEAKQEPPRAPVVQRAAPPPAPAQASNVLTRAPDPNEPIDLTGNTFVTGTADTYVGGVTTTNGTSKAAVYGATSPSGAPATHAAPPAAPPGPDRARVASVGSTEWNAPFPPEADALQIDEAHVTLQVYVRADGTVSEVRVLKDPGNGFGRIARSYALGQHFVVALDRDGHPIPGWTNPFGVTFSR
jgi:protein TonB